MMIDKKLVVAGVGMFILGGISSVCITTMMHRGYERGGDERERFGNNNYPTHGMMGGNYNNTNNSNDSTNQPQAGTQDVGQGMGMMDDMGGMTVTSEKDFIESMIPHHEEAIKTANEVIARGGTTPEIKTLAENIVKAQSEEVTNMKTWYKTWYGTVYVDNGKYQTMMQPLESLSGAELDKVFLTGMLQHHMGAIMMAKSVQSHIEHDEIKTLANTIVATQSAEIVTMKNLLAGLK
jgi:uncharacterized protein (DUF305 family)